MKTPKLTRKKFESLREMYKTVLSQYGAELIRDAPVFEYNTSIVGLDFNLPTAAGNLNIYCHKTSINTCFKDVEAAKRFLPHSNHDRFNSFSGKYNFTFYPEIVSKNHVLLFIENLRSYGLLETIVEVTHCGFCEEFHRVDYFGDCRNNNERFVDLEDAEKRLSPSTVIEVFEVDTHDD